MLHILLTAQFQEITNAEAVAWSSEHWRSAKKVFLKISRNSPENTSVKVSFLNKFQASNFFIKHLWWLLLYTFTFTIIGIQQDYNSKKE